MLAIEGRSGPGQDFELEFCDSWGPHDAEIAIPASARLKLPNADVKTDVRNPVLLRWTRHGADFRLVVDVPGQKAVPFDDAPPAIQKTLGRWVDKFAGQLRRAQER